jgi:hypothetical protein
MSSGAVAVVPAALLIPVVAGVAVAVAGAALAAALVIRAAQAGTESTGRALEHFADAVERHAQAQQDREVQARLWSLAAAAVVQANRELRLVAARAEKVGARVPLPEPFDLTGHGLADVKAWVAQVQESLATARAVVERAQAERERRVLVERLSPPADDSVTAADVLADYAKTLAARLLPVAPAPSVDKGRVRTEIDTILSRVDVHATAAEREELLLVAARATAQTDVAASYTFLESLARRVDEKVNPAAADRRQAAEWLESLEHPVVRDVIAQAVPPLPPQLAAVDAATDRLRAVIRGDADLTADDRRHVQDVLECMKQQVDQRLLREVLEEVLRGLGYSVTTGMQIGHTTALCVARESWNGAHSVDVWTDERGEVQWRLVEMVPDAPAEANRCEDINESMRAVGSALQRRGIGAQVQVPAVPAPALKRHDGRRQPNVYDWEAAPMAKQRSRDDEETR